MSSKDAYDKMSKEEKEELEKLMKEITEAAKKVVSTVEAKQYYKSLRSLSIRAGIKAPDKQSGAAPFGYKYDDNGTLQPDEDHGTLELIKTMKATGFSVVEIAKKTGLKEKKIYHILHYWRGK